MLGDYDVLLDLHAEKLVGTYDAVVINKDEKGEVQVHKHEKATSMGAWGGIAVGVLLCGVLFPAGESWARRRSGASSVGFVDTFARASRGDMKELGETLVEGEAALVVIGESRVGEQLDKALTRAEKSIEKQVDADSKNFKRDLEQAQKELAQAGTRSRELDPFGSRHTRRVLTGGQEGDRESEPEASTVGAPRTPASVWWAVRSGVAVRMRRFWPMARSGSVDEAAMPVDPLLTPGRPRNDETICVYARRAS